MATEEVELKFRADLSQLVSELQKAPGIGKEAAAAMVKDLDRQLKRSEKALKRNTTSARKQWKDVGDALGDVDSILKGLAGGLEQLSPELAEAANKAGDMVGAMEATAKIVYMLPGNLKLVGAAAGAAGFAFQIFTKNLADANAKITEAQTQQNALISMLDRLSAAQLRADEATGRLTGSALAEAKVQQEISTLYGEQLAQLTTDQSAAAKSVGELSARLEEQRAEMADTGVIAGFLGETFKQKVEIDKLTTELAAAEGALTNTGGEFKRVTGLAEAHAVSLREVAAAGAKTTTAQATVAAATDDSGAALQELTDIANDAYKSQLSGAELVTLELQEQLTKIEELGTAAQDTAAQSVAADAVRAQALAEIAALEAAAHSETMAALTKEADKKEADAQKEKDDNEAIAASEQAARQQMIGDLASSAATIFDLVADARMDEFQSAKQAFKDLGENASEAERAQLRSTLDASKKAAEQAWMISQGVAVAEATTNAAVATVGAWNYGPGAPFLIAAIGASLAANLAVIAAQQPSFHGGGMVGRDPSERSALLRTGEGVLTRQGVDAIGGPAALAAANSGGGGMGGPTVIQLRVGNQVAQEVVYQGTRGPGRGRQLTRPLRPTGRTNPYRTAP